MKKNRLIVVGILIIAFLFFLMSLFIRYGLKQTKGVVIRLNEGTFMFFGGGRGVSSNTTEPFKFPTVQYKANDSTFLYVNEHEILFSVPQLGDSVTILYEPNNAAESYIDKPGGFWVPLPQLLIFGLLCFFWIGICGIIFSSSVRS